MIEYKTRWREFDLYFESENRISLEENGDAGTNFDERTFTVSLRPIPQNRQHREFSYQKIFPHQT